MDSPGGDWSARELHCFLTLSQELHFGRTAERMHLTQARVSQAIRSLERRVGAVLFDRTSRRVELSTAGAELLAELAPAYAAIGSALERATARGRRTATSMTLGFVGPLSDALLALTERFTRQHRDHRVDFAELRLGDPLGPILRDEVDAAFVCAPVRHAELESGAVLVRDGRVVAMSRHHPLAGRPVIEAEELATLTFLGIRGPAPADWCAETAPTSTPHGHPITHGRTVTTLQEALVAIAAGQGSMIFPARLARYGYREDITFVPVSGLPESTISLVFRKAAATPAIAMFREFCTEHGQGPVGV